MHTIKLTGFLFNFTKHAEQSRFHSVTVQGMFSVGLNKQTALANLELYLALTL